MNDKFEKFTERARRVLANAKEEARRFQHSYIGTEHILLGLVREEEGVAAKVLANLDVDRNKVRSAVEFIIIGSAGASHDQGSGQQVSAGEINLTPRAKKVIELAVDEARRLNHHYIGTEHLLLGLAREGEGIAAGVLTSLGIDLEKVRREVVQVLNAPPGFTRGLHESVQQSQRSTTVGMSITNTTMLILYCRDVETTRAFYEDQLGATGVPAANLVVSGFANEDDVCLFLRRAGPLLALRAADPAHETIPTAAGTVEISVFVQEIDALWACWNALRLRNAPGLSEMEALGPDPNAPQLRAFSVSDPDARTLRFFSLVRES
jgi:hypothetical protein